MNKYSCGQEFILTHHKKCCGTFVAFNVFFELLQGRLLIVQRTSLKTFKNKTCMSKFEYILYFFYYTQAQIHTDKLTLDEDGDLGRSFQKLNVSLHYIKSVMDF